MNSFYGSPNRRSFMARLKLLTVVAALLVVAAGCGDDDDTHNNDTHNNDNHGHADAGWIEIETRGAASAIIAVWDEAEGWQDEDGDPISELPTPIDDDVDGLLPFTEMGPRASVTVRFFDADGTEVEMETLDRDEDTRERTCSEYSARYYPADGEEDTEVIYWGLMRHPDADNGNAQFIDIEGEVSGIFHCDHVHIYPKEEGTVDVEFVLWHSDHSDAVSDPLTIVVEGAD